MPYVVIEDSSTTFLASTFEGATLIKARLLG